MMNMPSRATERVHLDPLRLEQTSRINSGVVIVVSFFSRACELIREVKRWQSGFKATGTTGVVHHSTGRTSKAPRLGIGATLAFR